MSSSSGIAEFSGAAAISPSPIERMHDDILLLISQYVGFHPGLRATSRNFHVLHDTVSAVCNAVTAANLERTYIYWLRQRGIIPRRWDITEINDPVHVAHMVQPLADAMVLRDDKLRDYGSRCPDDGIQMEALYLLVLGALSSTSHTRDGGEYINTMVLCDSIVELAARHNLIQTKRRYANSREEEEKKKAGGSRNKRKRDDGTESDGSDDDKETLDQFSPERKRARGELGRRVGIMTPYYDPQHPPGTNGKVDNEFIAHYSRLMLACFMVDSIGGAGTHLAKWPSAGIPLPWLVIGLRRFVVYMSSPRCAMCFSTEDRLSTWMNKPAVSFPASGQRALTIPFTTCELCYDPDQIP